MIKLLIRDILELYENDCKYGSISISFGDGVISVLNDEMIVNRTPYALIINDERIVLNGGNSYHCYLYGDGEDKNRDPSAEEESVYNIMKLSFIKHYDDIRSSIISEIEVRNESNKCFFEEMEDYQSTILENRNKTKKIMKKRGKYCD